MHDTLFQKCMKPSGFFSQAFSKDTIRLSGLAVVISKDNILTSSLFSHPSYNTLISHMVKGSRRLGQMQ